MDGEQMLEYYVSFLKILAGVFWMGCKHIIPLEADRLWKNYCSQQDLPQGLQMCLHGEF